VRLRRFAFAGVVLAAVSLAPHVWAQEKRATAAQAAFDEARTLMEQGKYTEACAKFAKSQRMDAGMATQFRLAECYEKSGKLASAWRNYMQVATAARAAGMKEREEFAQKRADELDARLSTLQLNVAEKVAALDGLRLLVDDREVAPSEWKRLPLDVGKHEVLVRAPYYEEFRSSVDLIRDGEAVTVDVSELVAVQQEAVTVSDPSGAMFITGVIVGVVGLGGMAAGIGIGAMAKSEHDESQPECEGELCSQAGLDIREDARTTGDIGTGIFVAGAVLTAAGVGLSLASLAYGGDEEDEAVAFRVAVGPASLRAGVSW
jgi:hypothetical protein